MKTEKHIIKGHFKGKRPHVKVTAYELSTVDCSADKMSGYYSQEATLISDDPEPGYDFAGWSVTGSNVTGNNVRFEGDITAKANYSAHVYNVALENDGHGTIAANKNTGNIGDTITLSNTPATHYHFSGYSVTGATLTSNQFNIETNDVTAKGWFAEDPKYNLTLQNDGHGSIGAGKTTGYQGDTTTLSNTANNGYVFSAYSVTGAILNGSTLTFGAQNATAKAWFKALPVYALTLQNDGHGTITADKTTGHNGDTITLSNTPKAGYVLSGYTITGATLTSNKFKFGTGNVTAKGWFKYNIPTVKIGTQTWSKINIQLDDGGTGIYKFNNVTSGVNWGTQYYYTTGAAVRIANLIPGWRLPTENDIQILRTAATSTYTTSYPGSNLKTTTGWYKSNNGYDTFGFSGAPVGYMNINGVVKNVGNIVIYPLLDNSNQSGFRLQFNAGNIAFISTHTANGYSAFPLRLIKE